MNEPLSKGEQTNVERARKGAPTRAARSAMAGVPAAHRWLGAAIIFASIIAVMFASSGDLGVTWDEVYYRDSQLSMAKWFRALSACKTIEQAQPLLTKEAILSGWVYNRFGQNFHPPLAGILCNLTHAAFSRFVGDLPARRLASGIELAVAASVLFLFLSRRYGIWMGVIAAVSLAFMPRVFGDAHVAGTDMPLMTFWAVTALAFWNGLESAVWRVLFGVLFGLSLLVKFTALLIVVPLALWLLCYRIIPQWSLNRTVATLVGTVFVAWPLGVAGVELMRLSNGIRLATQQDRMLGPVIDDLARGILFRAFPHDPPLTADELRLAEQNMLSSRPDLTSAPIHASLYQALEDSFRSGTVQQWDSVEGPAALLRTIRTDALQYYFHRAGPYGEADLAEASRQLLGETAAKQGTTFEELIGHSGPFTAREWKHIAGRLDVPPLALDQYVAYEMPRLDLGVTARVPGWILFLPLLLWLIWNLISCLSFLPAGFRADGGLGLWLAGLGIAPAVAVAFNPTWWNETLPQLAHYYQISVGRQGSLPDIEIFYLGKKFFYSLPWHNGWILMAVTVPLAIGMIALLGIASAIWNWRRDPLRMFFLLQMITLPVSRMLPTPAHDGVRLMLPTFFFLAGLAGWGFEWIQQFVERLRSESYSPAPVLGVAAAFLLIPPGYWLYRSHPYELSYYNGLVGGLKGAQRAGFEPTYWYDAVTPQVVHDLNDSQRGIPLTAVLSLPEPQSILAASFPEGAHLTQLLKSLPERRINPQVFEELWLTRQLRRDIRVSGIRGVPPELDDFPYVALLTHSSKASPFTRLLYGLKPRASWEHEGVRLFSLYDPIAVARAWGLWILIDATDYSRPRIEPSLDRAMVDVARNNYRALYAAALRITETGLDKAMELEDDPQTILVLRKLASRRAFLQMVLARRKDALIESVEILSRTAEKRPELLEQLIESYDGYLPASELGRFLDEPTE